MRRAGSDSHDPIISPRLATILTRVTRRSFLCFLCMYDSTTMMLPLVPLQLPHGHEQARRPPPPALRLGQGVHRHRRSRRPRRRRLAGARRRRRRVRVADADVQTIRARALHVRPRLSRVISMTHSFAFFVRISTHTTHHARQSSRPALVPPSSRRRASAQAPCDVDDSSIDARVTRRRATAYDDV